MQWWTWVWLVSLSVSYTVWMKTGEVTWLGYSWDQTEISCRRGGRLCEGRSQVTPLITWPGDTR